MARSSILIFGIEAHQKYNFLQTSDLKLKSKNNGLGAIGDIYRDQPIRIAVFGTSINEMGQVLFKEKWAEQLAQILGNENVHID